MDKQKLIVIIGPTAVGKTKLSIELAKRFDGEIISGDSAQIFKGMDMRGKQANPIRFMNSRKQSKGRLQTLRAGGVSLLS